MFDDMNYVLRIFGIFFSPNTWHLEYKTFIAHAPYRYDARLLLDALPPIASPVEYTSSNNDVASRPDSPGGWSDLPSDTEDTFFLTPEETTDLHRTKRLRYLDALRTARLRALSPDTTTTDGDANADTDLWGGSDEEVW
jgi:hypothetical protein